MVAFRLCGLSRAKLYLSAFWSAISLYWCTVWVNFRLCRETWDFKVNLLYSSGYFLILSLHIGNLQLSVGKWQLPVPTTPLIHIRVIPLCQWLVKHSRTLHDGVPSEARSARAPRGWGLVPSMGVWWRSPQKIVEKSTLKLHIFLWFYHRLLVLPASACNSGANFFQSMTGRGDMGECPPPPEGGHSPMSPLWLRP